MAARGLFSCAGLRSVGDHRLVLADGVVLAGAAAIVFGCAMLSPAAGWIAGGVVLLFAGYGLHGSPR